MVTDETKIATIGKDIEYMRKDISEIKDSLKALPGIYVTQREFAEFVLSTDTRFKIAEAERRLWRWLSPSLAALFSSVITYLFINYLQHLKN